MGRKQNRARSPSPAPGPEATVATNEPAPQAPVEVLYCAGTLLSGTQDHQDLSVTISVYISYRILRVWK